MESGYEACQIPLWHVFVDPTFDLIDQERRRINRSSNDD